MVPGAGIEPARPLSRKILSLVCLPIPPPGLRESLFIVGIGTYLFDVITVEVAFKINATKVVEARVGIEPALTDLQSAA